MPLPYLRAYQSSAHTSLRSDIAAADPPPQAASEDEADGFVMPEHLKAQPTDTDEQRAKKRKKIKALKLQIKTKEADALSSSKQNSWTSFVKKQSGKKVKGGVKADSMFASPDAVNGKVGVTGSGSGLTEFEQRKRWDLSLSLPGRCKNVSSSDVSPVWSAPLPSPRFKFAP